MLNLRVPITKEVSKTPLTKEELLNFIECEYNWYLAVLFYKMKFIQNYSKEKTYSINWLKANDIVIETEKVLHHYADKIKREIIFDEIVDLRNNTVKVITKYFEDFLNIWCDTSDGKVYPVGMIWFQFQEAIKLLKVIIRQKIEKNVIIYTDLYETRSIERLETIFNYCLSK